jgi:hypothetical protein
MPTHRVVVQDALIALFQIPVPDEDSVGRTVLTRVLGPSVSIGNAIFNFWDNEHLKNLMTPGSTPVVWESKQKPNTRTVLNPINNAGQEVLLDVLGGFCFISSFPSVSCSI